MARLVLRVGIVLYLGLCLVFAAFQTSLIFPGASTQGRPGARVVPAPGAELLELRTERGECVAALFAPALTDDGRPHPDARSCPTVLFFYGNGMCLAACDAELAMFRRLGTNVLIPDYLGYGLSGGVPGEAGCYVTADVALDHLLHRPDVDPARIVAAGWSLGGAVAIDLASRREEIAALAAFSTFTCLADAARAHMPLLPFGLLLQHRFESDRKIARVRGPILLGHGAADEIIPAAHMEQLARAAGRPVARILVPHAGHNDFFDTGRAPVDAALRELLRGLEPAR